MITMKNKKIAFDLDGVVYDFISPLDTSTKNNGYPLVDGSSYDIRIRYGVDENVGNLLLNNFGWQRPFTWIPLYEKAKAEMLKLSKDNEIYIVTHRDWTENGVEDTLARIQKDRLPVSRDNIIFSKDKGYCANKFGIDLFYEDLPENVVDILRQSNSLVRMVDTPYNKRVLGEGDNTIPKEFRGRVARVQW